jgi:hypothetical protein
MYCNVSNHIGIIRKDGGLESNRRYPQKPIAAIADTVNPTPNRQRMTCAAALSALSTSKDGCSYTSKIRMMAVRSWNQGAGNVVTVG